jgi:ketosteroid isomerase-like protein
MMSTRGFVHLAAVAALLFSLVSTRTAAQQWSAEEQEVWQAIEDCHARWRQKDMQGVEDCFHDDFVGWRSEDLVPRTKNTHRIFGPVQMESGTLVAVEIRPVAMGIFGNVAIAHYSLHGIFRSNEGVDTIYQERWTDVLMKEGGQWRCIGDAGGQVKAGS